MKSDFKERFFAIAQDGKNRTSEEVAEAIGIGNPNQFLNYLKLDLVLRKSEWRLVKLIQGSGKNTLWRLEKR